ncbi:MAG: hypothetical protein M3067_06605 [Chloroflexota bacterium]|nr:hypothetical protein [Chloroflexota bacterium]
MMRRWRSGLLYAAVAIQVVLLAGELVLDQLANRSQTTAGTALPSDLAGAASILIFPTVGLVIFARRPDHPIGWLFVFSNFGWAINNFAGAYVRFGTLSGRSLPISPDAMAWFYTWPGSIAVGLTILLILLFPSGHLPSRNWRWALWLLIGWTAVSTVASAFAPGPVNDAIGVRIENPLGMGGAVGSALAVLLDASFIVTILPVVAAFAAMTARFRASRSVERQQMKWMFGAVALVVLLGLQIVVEVYDPSARDIAGLGAVIISLSILSFALIPIAAAVAILRYRLYDIDRIISRTLAYGLITALLVAVFLVVNLGLQSLLSFVTSGNSLAVAGSTLLAAALFTPVRRRVQRIVDRRFDRARYDGERTASAFSARMRDATDLPTVAADLSGTVRRAIAASSVGLWLRGSDQ